MVCSTWSDLIGVDAFLWSHIDVSLSWRGVWTLADWERHLRYQFAAHKRHSRGVELHLQCEENDLPWVQPYLRDMALRWASIRLEGASWCRPYLTEHRYCDAAPPLSFPTVREMTFRAGSIDEGSNLDILKCGPAVRRLAIWLERWQTTPVVALRLPLPVSPGLTSLLLDVFGGARLDTSGVCVALQQCSATLETLDISTDTTLNPSKPIALPRLLRLYVHDKACSLLQVLRTERLMTLCIEEKSEADNSLTLLRGALVDGRIAGSTLRQLQLTDAYHHDRPTSMELVVGILDAASYIDALALVYTECQTYTATCREVLTVLYDTSDGLRLPHLRRLTLVVGRSADDITTVSCLGQFLYKRDGADLHLITDIDYFIGQHMCTYTFLEDEDIDGYLLGSYERW